MIPGITRYQGDNRYARGDALDIRKMGAVSGQNCTTAIDAARQVSNNLYFPQGTWLYGGAGLDWSSLFIRGAGRSKSIIGLAAGTSLVVGTGTSPRFGMSDVRVDGGFGAIRLTGTGDNVASVGGLSVRRVDFLNYTGAAISEQFADCPNWTIRECSFTGVNDTTCFGIVLTGDCADSLVEQCNFGRNKAHIKIANGYGGNALTLRKNAFVRGNSYTDHARIDVWVVPSTIGNSNNQAVYLDDCKLGPENRMGADTSILVALQDSAVADPALSQPDMTAAVGYEAKALRVHDCLFGSNTATPLITSTVAFLPLLEVSGLIVYGQPPDYLVKYVNPTAVDATAGGGQKGRVTGIINKDAGATAPVALSNATRRIAWVVNDPNHTIDVGGSNITSETSGGGDRLGYIKTITTANAAAMLPGSGNTIAPVTDALGGTDAIEVTSTSNFYTWATVAGVIAGELHWLEFDLAPPSTGVVADIVDVWVTTSAGSTDQRFSVRMPTSWRRFRFSYIPGTTVVTQMRIFSDLATSGARIGRVRTYHAAEPQITDVVNGLTGPGSDPWLKQAAAAFGLAFTAVTATNAATALPTAATVRWPDGTSGAFTATIDAGSNGYSGWTAAYGTKTVTAAGITYDTNGLAYGPTSITVA